NGRLATLLRDREDRVRLEGAIRRTARALENLEQGRASSWPESSGTALDPLVSRLRELRLVPPVLRLPYERPYAVHGSRAAGEEQTLGSTGSVVPFRPLRARSHRRLF